MAQQRWIIPLALAGALTYYVADKPKTHEMPIAPPRTQVAQAPGQSPSRYSDPLLNPEKSEELLYYPHDIWYDRMKAMEKFARANPPVSRRDRARLEKIAVEDEHPINQRLAEDLLDSIEKHGDLTYSQPYMEMMKAQKRSVELRGVRPFGYDAQRVWYDRLDALATAVCSDASATKDDAVSLSRVAHHENDWRITRLAREMEKSIEQTGSLKLARGTANCK